MQQNQEGEDASQERPPLRQQQLQERINNNNFRLWNDDGLESDDSSVSIHEDDGEEVDRLPPQNNHRENNHHEPPIQNPPNNNEFFLEFEEDHNNENEDDEHDDEDDENIPLMNEEEEEDEDEEEDDGERNNQRLRVGQNGPGGIIAGGSAVDGKISADCDMTILIEYVGISPNTLSNHPILSPTVTVEIGLDRTTKLLDLFQQYCTFANSYPSSDGLTLPSKQEQKQEQQKAQEQEDPSKQQKHPSIEPSDLEFYHCSLLDPSQTTDTSALMAKDRIQVRFVQRTERKMKIESLKVQHDIDKNYFDQLRLLMPDLTPSPVKCDIVFHCKGRITDEKGYKQEVLNTFVKGHAAVLAQRCRWLRDKISWAKALHEQQQQRQELGEGEQHLSPKRKRNQDEEEYPSGHENESLEYENKNHKPIEQNHDRLQLDDDDEEDGVIFGFEQMNEDNNEVRIEADAEVRLGNHDDDDASHQNRAVGIRDHPENRLIDDDDDEDDRIRPVDIVQNVHGGVVENWRNRVRAAGQIGRNNTHHANAVEDDEEDNHENRQPGDLLEPESQSNMSFGHLPGQDAVIVLLSHPPEAVKLLLEFCYTNRVISLGFDAFVQSFKPRDIMALDPLVEKYSSQISPFHPNTPSNWPHNGLPTVSLQVALAGIQLAEEAKVPRLSLMCEIAATHLFNNAAALEVLAFCESQYRITGNRLPLLGKAVMNHILMDGPRGIYHLSKFPSFRRTLNDRKETVVSALFLGIKDALQEPLAKKAINLDRRERSTSYDAVKLHNDQIDQEDKICRNLERQEGRKQRWSKRPRYWNPYRLDDPTDDPLMASITSIIFDVENAMMTQNQSLRTLPEFRTFEQKNAAKGRYKKR